MSRRSKLNITTLLSNTWDFERAKVNIYPRNRVCYPRKYMMFERLIQETVLGLDFSSKGRIYSIHKMRKFRRYYVWLLFLK